MHKTILFLSCAAILAACGGGGGGGDSSSPVTQTPPPTAQAPTPAPVPAPNPPTASITIDVLPLMSPGVEDQFVDADLRINHLFSTANAVLADSGVNLILNSLQLEVVAYPDGHDAETALRDVTNGTHPTLAHVAALRETLAADLVVFFRPYANDGRCGYAWIGGYGADGDFSNAAERDFAYSVVAANCSDYTLLHEIGHNLGLAHSRREASDGGTYAWSVGHGSDNDFVTIMASPDAFNATRLPRLASPNLDCNGTPCGVDAGLDPDNGADAVSALEVTASQVAEYY